MSPPTLAVIDLGTNTFHLLIVRGTDEHGNFNEVYRERRFIKLAEDGIETIGQQPFWRGMEALRHFREMMDEHGVTRYQATGTAALRTATNGPEFVKMALEDARIRIDLVPGSEEARLITKGVLQAIPAIDQDDRVLIMDIGGGSVEFIIADARGTLWAQSFPIGVAVLKRGFHHHEPISEQERTKLSDFLVKELEPLWVALADFPTDHLVGAAGTFDVIANLMGAGQPTRNSHAIELAKFAAFSEQCIAANQQERLRIEGLPLERADLIVVAFILIQAVLGQAGIKRATVSNYAMKEGILAEMI